MRKITREGTKTKRVIGRNLNSSNSPPKKKAAKKKTAKVRVNELEAVIAKIHKSRGDKVILPARKMPLANCISTGCFILDYALLGGIPDGFATILFGKESAGKTFLAKKAVAAFQRKYPDKTAVWIDTEGMFDSLWAEVLGVDLDRLQVVRPDTGNEAVDLLEALMEPIEVGLVVMDSIAGCVPKRIIEYSSEDQTMSELARLMGIMSSKMLHSWAEQRKRDHWVTVIYTNQLRLNPGVKFGSPEYSPGGKQINHIPTTRIKVKNTETKLKDSVDTFGNQVIDRNVHSFDIIKAKHGRSIRSGEFTVAMNPLANYDLPQGTFMDFKTVVAQAKRMGQVAGGGKGGYRMLCIGKKPHRTLDDMAEHLMLHPNQLETVKQHLIMMQRVDKGLPALPEDRYLLNWNYLDEDHAIENS